MRNKPDFFIPPSRTGKEREALERLHSALEDYFKWEEGQPQTRTWDREQRLKSICYSHQVFDLQSIKTCLNKNCFYPLVTHPDVTTPQLEYILKQSLGVSAGSERVVDAIEIMVRRGDFVLKESTIEALVEWHGLLDDHIEQGRARSARGILDVVIEGQARGLSWEEIRLDALYVMRKVNRWKDHNGMEKFNDRSGSYVSSNPLWSKEDLLKLYDEQPTQDMARNFFLWVKGSDDDRDDFETRPEWLKDPKIREIFRHHFSGYGETAVFLLSKPVESEFREDFQWVIDKGDSGHIEMALDLIPWRESLVRSLSKDMISFLLTHESRSVRMKAMAVIEHYKPEVKTTRAATKTI